MGAKFDQWLAKPSTLHFLRCLVDPRSHSLPVRPGFVTHLCCSTQVRFQTSQAVARKDHDTEPRYGTEPLENEAAKSLVAGPSSSPEELALRMSLSSGLRYKNGKARNITFNELMFQADVTSEKTFGKLRVDKKKHQHNIALWIEILRFQQRMNGFSGVFNVWKGMRRRGVDLPVSGSEAEMLWTTFTHAGISMDRSDDITDSSISSQRKQLRSEVFEYAKDLKARTGQHFQGLYKCIVGRWFRVYPGMVRSRHNQLAVACFFCPGAVKSIAADAVLSVHSNLAFERFSTIYEESGERDLYDVLINEALKSGDDEVVLRWHRLLMRHGDAPSSDMFERPDVQRLFDLDGGISLAAIRNVKYRSKEHHGHWKHALNKRVLPISRASMSVLVGDAHGIKPKEISDKFCAKMFATQSFSLDLIIKGLSFFGVEKLGPLATREMAVRAGTAVEFCNKFALLEAAGITFNDSTFTRLVIDLAKDGHNSLWEALLASDQHPEAYEDPELQELLLMSYLAEGKLSDAHLTLVVLTLIEPGASPYRAWNRILQHYIETLDYRLMLNTMQSMHNQKLRLTVRTVKSLYHHVLPPRKPGKRYTKGTALKLFDPLDFTRNAVVHFAEQGQFLPHQKLVELLKRYGMDHRWDDTERLVLWIVDWYSKQNAILREQLQAHLYLGRKRLLLRMAVLKQVFSPYLLKALFTWGFRSASDLKRLYIPDQERSNDDKSLIVEPWARGLALLKLLKDKGILQHPADAQWAFRHRMWILFGPAYSARRINNEARQLNQLNLAHYINHANQIFPGLVDWVDPQLLLDRSQADPRLLVEFFGRLGIANWRRREFVNVKAWTDALGRGQHNYFSEPRNIPQRAREWERSKFRLKLSERELTSLVEIRALSRHPLPEHQSPSARSESSHPPPNQ